MTHVSAHDNWVGMDGSLPSVREALENTWQTLLLWQRRYSDRRALFGLDDRMLRDIGLTRADVTRECANSFWRAPETIETILPAPRGNAETCHN